MDVVIVGVEYSVASERDSKRPAGGTGAVGVWGWVYR